MTDTSSCNTLQKVVMPSKTLKRKKKSTATVSFVEELKRQWMSTVDALRDPLLLINPENYQIKKANLAFAHLIKKNITSVIGKKCYSLFFGLKAPCSGCLLKKTVHKACPHKFEIETSKDVIYDVSSQPLINAQGEVESVVHAYRDVTEERNIQRYLLQKEKLSSLGLMAGGMAHELNNPLGGIMLFSQILLKELPSNSKYRKDVEEIESAVKRCKTVVESLLNYARFNDKGAVKEKDIDVNEALLEALRLASMVPYSKKFKKNVSLVKEPCLVDFERNQLIHLFLNLIQNAFHAMLPDGGSLTLSSRIEKKGKKILGVWCIQDTGHGIPKEKIGKIFDPFFTTKEPGQGTGLGLSICYSLCEQLGGSIRVESEKGVGSRFFITLPLKKVTKYVEP